MILFIGMFLGGGLEYVPSFFGVNGVLVQKVSLSYKQIGLIRFCVSQLFYGASRLSTHTYAYMRTHIQNTEKEGDRVFRPIAI